MPRHRSLAIPAIVALLVLMATATAVAALSIEAPACDGVKLRTGPTTAYPIKAAVGPTVTLTVVDEVSGSWWQSLCAGHVVSGKTWAKISVIDGATAQSRFGVPYVYAAAGLLQVLASDSDSPSVEPTTPASPSTAPTVAPTPTPPDSPVPSDTASPSPPVPTATPPAATASSGSAVPIAPNQTGSTSDPLNGPAATVVLILAVLSTTLSWLAVADRRRRRSRRVATPESVSSARLDEVQH